MLGIECWVAGGAVRAYLAAERISDIDLFFTSEQERQKGLERINNIYNDAEQIFENENVTKIKADGRIFDFCKPIYDSAEECINSFDFTVSAAAVTIDEGFISHDDFFIDLAARRLAIISLSFPMSSLTRFQKYIKKGYWMCAEEMIKFTAALQGVDLSEFLIDPNLQQAVGQGSDSSSVFPGID